MIEFSEVLATAEHSAVHLEMRDVYNVDSEREEFAAWRDGFRYNLADRSSWWRPWLDLMQETIARGVVVRRARIVSEPVSAYIRYEYDGTFANVAAGEQVRWLPRRRATGIALPGNDFWLFDDHTVVVNHFTGDGQSAGPEVIRNAPDLAKLCTTAFETVWDRTIPHEEYKP